MNAYNSRVFLLRQLCFYTDHCEPYLALIIRFWRGENKEKYWATHSTYTQELWIHTDYNLLNYLPNYKYLSHITPRWRGIFKKSLENPYIEFYHIIVQIMKMIDTINIVLFISNSHWELGQIFDCMISPRVKYWILHKCFLWFTSILIFRALFWFMGILECLMNTLLFRGSLEVMEWFELLFSDNKYIHKIRCYLQT